MIILFLGKLSILLVNLYIQTLHCTQYTWSENVPNPLLFTITITKCLERHGTWMSSASLHCCQQYCTQYPLKRVSFISQPLVWAKSKLKSHVGWNHGFLLSCLHCPSLRISWPPKVSDYNIK